jgi:hypothetical protein
MGKKIVLTSAVIGTLIIIGLFLETFEVLIWDFRNELWAPAYLLVHGESPYNIQVLFKDGSTAVWLPQIIGVFFPLGWLSLKQASNLWLIINALTIIGMTIFLTRQANLGMARLPFYSFILLGVFLFPPTASYFWLGQVDFLLIAAMLLSAWGMDQQDAKTAALGFTLALTKPQLCFVVLPSAFIWLMIKGRWKYGLKVIALLVLFLLVSTIPLWLADLHWIKDFIQSFLRNSGGRWLQPALFTQLQVQFGRTGLMLWLVVAISCIAISTILWNKLEPRRAILWSLALTTIAAPYIWSWDFTLLLPLFIDTAARLTKVSARLVLILAWLACFFFSVWSRQFEASDHRLWWLPFTMLFGIIASLQVDRIKNRNLPQ